MKSVTPTELRSNIYQLLDEIIQTGVPIEIDRNGVKLKITTIEPVNKLKNLVPHPDFVNGDPDDLPTLTWEDELNLDFP